MCVDCCDDCGTGVWVISFGNYADDMCNNDFGNVLVVLYYLIIS